MTLNEQPDYKALIEDARDYAGVDEYGGAVLLREVATAVEVLREQLAAAEAVIEAALTFDEQQTVDGVTDRGYLSPDEWRDERIAQILAAAPSSVLADAKADAWDEGAEIVLRVVGIESVENALANLAENGHANPHRSEQ